MINLEIFILTLPALNKKHSFVLGCKIILKDFVRECSDLYMFNKKILKT